MAKTSGRAGGGPDTPAYMVQLDSLRAIAALIVIVSHSWPQYFSQIYWGYGAVLLFFVLSGFLITGILLRTRQRIEASNEAPLEGLKRFYLRRTLRIFPLYYAATLFAIAYFPQARESWEWHVAYSVNFLMAHTADFVGATSAFWSLGVEEQFYLFWPMIILFAPLRWFIPAIGLMIFAGPASRIICLNYNYHAFYYLPTSCLDSLGLGALLALCRHRGIRVRRRWLRLLPLLTVDALAALYFYAAYDASLKETFQVVASLCVSVIFTCIVGAASTGYKGAVGKMLEFKPLVYLGRISYGLYVYHSFTPYIMTKIMREVAGMASAGPAFEILSVLFTVLVSSLSWHFFEKPINNLKEGFRAQRKVKLEAASPSG